MPLDSLWRNSEKLLWSAVPSDGNTFPVWIFLCAALLLGFSATSHHFHFPDRKTPVSLTQVLSVIFLLIFSSAILGGTATYLSLFPGINLLSSSLFFLTIVSAKIFILLAIEDVSETHCFKMMIPTNVVLASSISCLTAIFALGAILIPDFSQSRFFLVSLAVTVIIAILLYLCAVIRTLFSAKISPFYSFLYLCTLEFIPIVVLTVMFTRL